MIKGFISSAMFTLQHIRAKESNSISTRFIIWLWEKVQRRKFENCKDAIKQHSLFDEYKKV